MLVFAVFNHQRRSCLLYANRVLGGDVTCNFKLLRHHGQKKEKLHKKKRNKVEREKAPGRGVVLV